MDLALFFQIYMYKKSVFICRIYHFQNCSLQDRSEKQRWHYHP